MRSLLALAAVVLLPGLARADFEGVIEAKMSGSVSGTSRTFVSKAGVRHEMTARSPLAEEGAAGATIRTVFLMKTSQPDTTYLVDEGRRTYTVIERRERHGDEETYKVEKLGKDTVAGYACERALLTGSRGMHVEVCVAPGLVAGEAWLRAFRARGQDRNRGLPEALRKAGLEGMPVRWSTIAKGREGTITVEVTSVRKQSVPDSTFVVPAGYTKSEMAIPGLNPEAAKKMEEMMKQLTPEQRKQMEEMMKQHGGQQGQ